MTSHKEIFIPKSDHGYAFTYFDFQTEEIVKVAPRKTDWDISFTTMAMKLESGNLAIAYSFSDYVYANKVAGVKVYGFLNTEVDISKSKHQTYVDLGLTEVNTELTYENFNAEKLDAYVGKLKNTRIIPGDLWRNVFNMKMQPYFFLIQDADGNIYKLRFLEMTNEQGERGHTKIEYELLK